MPVFYNKIEKSYPGNPAAPKKWYATLKRISLVKEKEVVKQIASGTAISRKEAEIALDQFQKVLIYLLSEGNSVQLGDWGSFHLTCGSEGQERKEDVTAATIRKVYIRFAPGKELKEALQKVSFKDVKSMSVNRDSKLSSRKRKRVYG
ncbi:MAG: HU family DNA-binding protein [Bacteroidales bacterium]|jgi:predicted histone-like DNA-binding protein|nr:HU family DNA-binding protein [Bacteroidales bacterium]